ncbi:uncharacterized protein LOC128771168 [Synchiropus splendidus]|uniref:uncharacterized protein LOC128771168 n=1 Tax=Synchiropus splendidus TaxID=270530 RepID=UPI00237E397C|nr:uncharacterized protein LOC128771168 [Synchiropus splendidus]XP_053742330.1 uncharacterized protein LOC128771168 [Synchiropus splendidus]
MEEVSLELIGLCVAIYHKAKNAQSNKERCQSLAQRVKSLEKLVVAIKKRGRRRISSVEMECLKELHDTLTAAKQLIEKYSVTSAFVGFVKSSSHEEKFSKMNDRITCNFELLRGAMQIEQEDMMNKIFDKVEGGTRVRREVSQPPSSSSTASNRRNSHRTSSALNITPATTVARTAATPAPTTEARTVVSPAPTTVARAVATPAPTTLARAVATPAATTVARAVATPAATTVARAVATPAPTTLARAVATPAATTEITTVASPLTPSPTTNPYYSPVIHFMASPTVPVMNRMMAISPGAVSYVTSSTSYLPRGSSVSVSVTSAHNSFCPTVTPLSFPYNMGSTQSWTVPLSPQNTAVITTPNYYVIH